MNRSRLQSGLVLAAIVYYWAYLYLRVLMPPADESTLTYALTIVPIAAIAAAGLMLGLTQQAIDSQTARRLLALLAFVTLVAAVGLARRDGATILSAGLLGLTLAWLCFCGPVVTTRLLNRLFALSIVVGTLAFAADLAPYGLLPGQYGEGGDRGIAWRVSLFPYVPESAFFALLVLLQNRFDTRRGVGRWLWIAAALYFLLLSGVRSAVIAWLMCEAYLLLSRVRPLAAPNRRVATMLLLVAGFVVVLSGSGALLLLWPGIADSPVSSWMFREFAGDLSEDAIEQSVYRTWLWGQHVELFASSPLVGIGSFDFGGITGSLVEGASDTGSESFLTAWLARVGLCLLPLLWMLLSLSASAARRMVALPACALLIFFVAALAYGSFIVPYNLVFLLLFSLLLARPARMRVDTRRPRAGSRVVVGRLASSL